MFRLLPRALALALPFVLSHPAGAADAVPSVVITGRQSATPPGALRDEIVTTESINAREIEKSGASNLPELMAHRPGVDVQVECSVCNVRNITLNNLPGRFTTLAEHRPKSHQRYLEWTPSRILEWVKTIGPDCAQVVAQILADRPHPEQGFRSALGIIRLGKAVGHDRLEAACRRALHFGTCSYVSLKSILQNKLDGQPLEPELPLPSPVHENLRGSPYYH